MKYESVKLLFQQDKYVQLTSVLMLLVFGYSFFTMTQSLTKNLDSNQVKTIYEIKPGTPTLMGEIYSGKSWVLKPCSKPAGICWVVISPP